MCGYVNFDDNGRKVKIRKTVCCEWCNELVQKGTIAIIRVYKWDGDFQNARVHPECYEAMQKSLRGYGYEGSFEPQAQKRGKTIDETENYGMTI